MNEIYTTHMLFPGKLKLVKKAHKRILKNAALWQKSHNAGRCD